MRFHKKPRARTGVVVIIPIVLAYQANAYWICRGKTRHDGYGEASAMD